MNILEYIKDHTLFLDGGMGTLLQAKGLLPGELPEAWNLSHPDVVTDVHRAYFLAGANVVNTNTFGANVLHFDEEELDAVVCAAIENARRAAEGLAGERYVALDVGPSGRMLAPYGDLAFEDAVEIFAKTVRLGVKYGADLIFIETMNDSYECKAALLAAKENSTLPVFVSCAFGEDGKLLTGASPAAMVAMLEGLGADAIGVNCSQGPRALRPVVEEYLRYASVPVLFKPNAGLPRVEGDKTVFDVTPDDFANEIAPFVKAGVRAVGGCCGTTPAHIAALFDACHEIPPAPLTKKTDTVISSYTHAVFFGESPVLIGERINPTGKPRFKEALRAGDIDYILREGLSEEEAGAQVLDVNVGLPEIDEGGVLCELTAALQAVCALPLQIDTASPEAMARALRIYNGKPMINSVNGKRESLDAILPLAKKYGGLVVALTLDEDGIPEKAEGRLLIARRILDAAEKYGIEKKNIIFDPLTMAVSADKRAALETLRAVKMIREELGVHTSLGVSNVSFGLPAREHIGAAFFTMAMQSGLSAAIMNPHAAEMMKAYYTFRALSGQDENFLDYIAFASTLGKAASVPAAAPAKKEESAASLREAIAKGLGARAAALTADLLKEREGLAIVQEEIIPALNEVGEGFEKKTVFLPQLLICAEAAKSAFEVIKARAVNKSEGGGLTVVLATVKGDIHDIGKNIVKLLLENYGFTVADLGKDVAPERVVEEVLRLGAPLVGLSALMTTTVGAMEKTICLLRERAPFCRVMVGGAVLTPEYADAIGADAYARDAMGAVRYAQEVSESL
ncbi:MAG: homocysteine S-methyltransferase family protein [Clostridia bacterium]|nr:homocysteine S-methyltransferase family protein [Clostridia bacterium]